MNNIDALAYNFGSGPASGVDLAPSIIFLVIYTLSIPFLVWRTANPYHRSKLLLRLALFLTCRIAALLLRAVISKVSLPQAALVAELTLTVVPYLFLAEALVELWINHVNTAVTLLASPSWVRQFAVMLRLFVYAAIGTGIAAGATIYRTVDNDDQMRRTLRIRKASAALALVVPALALFAIPLTHFVYKLDARRSALIFGVTSCLMVVSSYNLSKAVAPIDSTPHPRALFWVFHALFECIAYIALLSVSLPKWYPPPLIENTVPNPETGSDSTDDLVHPSEPEAQAEVELPIQEDKSHPSSPRALKKAPPPYKLTKADEVQQVKK